MPAAAPILIGAAFSGISISAAGVIAFSWSAFAGSLILGGLSMALTPKPKKPAYDPNTLSNSGSTVALRQPDLTRQIAYGHMRITRGYAHMESTGLNGRLHIILMLCEGPIRAINEIWLNDYSIPNDWIDSEGNVTTGRYAGRLVIRKHLGTETQSADPLAVSNMPLWTTDHRLQGIAYLYLIMDKDQDVYPTGVPNVSAIIEGREVYDPREGTEVWTTNMALTSNDFLRNDLYGFGALAADVDEVNIAAQANICDEIVTTPAVDMEVDSVNTTLSTLTLDGDLLLYQYGDQVEVITTGTAPGGLSTATSYYVVPYQIKLTPRIQLATSLENALNKVIVDITSSGTGVNTIRKTGEPRYHGSGIVDSEMQLSQTMNDMVTCMAGRAVNVGGFWTLLAGAWRAPDLAFGIGDIRGSGMGIKNALSMGESFNIVKGLYISSLNLYQESDYPSAVYQAFIAQDNGLESPKDLNLPYINRPNTAQRIAKIELFRGRQDIVYTSDFSTKGLQVKPGDTVELNIDKLGWTNKEFEVTEFSFDVGNGDLITSLTLRETAAEIYDWAAGEAIDYDPAPNTNLPNPFLVQVPSGVSYNSRYIDTREGDAVYTLTLNWLPHPDAFVREFGDFEVQYKLSDEDDWRPSFFVDGSLTQTDVVNSSVNVFYDLRIRARNNLGVRSGWVTILGAVVGSSGGIGATLDWEFVNVAPSLFNDWGNVYDAPAAFEDWGYVA